MTPKEAIESLYKVENVDLYNVVNGWLGDACYPLRQEFSEYKSVMIIEETARDLWEKGLRFDTVHEMEQALYIQSLEKRIEKLEGMIKALSQRVVWTEGRIEYLHPD